MTLEHAGSGEVVSEDEYLEGLASRIREEHRRLKDASFEIIDAYFAIGQCLSEARDALRSDQAFGAWFNAQQFPFTRQWAHTLRTAANNDVAVRAAVASQLATGNAANIEKAVKEVTAGSRPAPKSEKPAAPERSSGYRTHGRPEQIKEAIREQANSSLTSEQIAQQFGVKGYYVRRMASEIGVELHADKVVGHYGKSVDSNRVLNGIVERVRFDIGEGTAELIEYSALDRDQIDEWVSSLSLTIGSLTYLRNNLKNELTRG